ncbi:MAG: ABC transporter permease [Clostridia bacterium]|nr:ABC transporter permease [Clostridia bacterium]
MNSLLFAKRNIKNFFKDKMSVFFSLLSAIIIIGLYVLFLGDMIVGNLQVENARFIVDSWIMAGVISVTSITTAMGAYEAMVKDKESNAIKDYYAAPVKRNDIIIGYVLSAFVIGIAMTFVSLLFAQVYILIYGGYFLPFFDYIKIFAIIVLSVISNCFFVFFLVSFIKTNAAFATASTILGTLIGFVAGVYLPIGQLPSSVQFFVKIFPVSHSALLLRQVMMGDALVKSFPAEMLKEFRLDMGVDFSIGGTVISPWLSVIYLILVAALFFVLIYIKVSRKSK